jgi:hypothetical protein
MMNKLTLLFVCITAFARTQTVIYYDYMETWNWAGLWWTPALTANWFANASVTPTESAVIYGLGSGTSGNEQDWYSLPNVTGLDATKQYQFRFRLASYTFSNATASSRGVDAADYVSVQVSTNGGVTYVTELRIAGNSNATWPYTSTGVVAHVANGTFTNAAAPAGDVYTAPVGATTTAPTFISLSLPAGITQVAVDLFCRVNAAGEEWWIDNIELVEVPALPVELMSFEGYPTDQGNLLIWKTATEHNSAYYLIERSQTGEFGETSVISQKTAAGWSSIETTYSHVDIEFRHGINYYQITQVDNDGQYKVYGPIAINNTISGKLIRIINALGQEVDETATGILFEIYEDGTIKQIRR